MTNQINYFDKRRNKSLLNYDKISQLNLPIGSGAVESLIRQAVNLRLKGNGKFWLAGLKQKLRPNKPTTGSISYKYVTIMIEPFYKTKRHGCTKCLQCFRKCV